MNPAELQLDPATTALLIIDVQEKLLPAMHDAAACLANVTRLAQGAQWLGLRTLVTEQYPKGIGPTVAPLIAALQAGPTPATVLEKLEFGATANPIVAEALDRWQADGVRQVLVCGIEAHICVYQTVRGLRERGLQVHVVRDASSSRTAANLEVAVGLWRRCGALVTSTEAVLFDLVGSAAHPHFRAISKLIR
jgi:nicotinamidase-related amidase